MWAVIPRAWGPAERPIVAPGAAGARQPEFLDKRWFYVLPSRLIFSGNLGLTRLETISQSHRTLRFGVFDVDLRTAELRKHGVRIRLEEQPFHILTLLLECPGELVPREELRETLGLLTHLSTSTAA